ncbi:MAG: NUDIX domain-containing protein [Acidobacteria bacterium]|nr:MAG: NUDIX domain-containing protein [Acidobacteriota bacterium]
MAKMSAGLLLYRMNERGIEVFLIHPGGPIWAAKDLGAWSIPKGEPDADEEWLKAAIREFEEETGIEAATGPFVQLAPITQKGGKQVFAWACEGDCDATTIKSNLFSMEWPPRSGRQREFPEADRAGWFPLEEARRKINPAQVGLLDQLEGKIEAKG